MKNKTVPALLPVFLLTAAFALTACSNPDVPGSQADLTAETQTLSVADSMETGNFARSNLTRSGSGSVHLAEILPQEETYTSADYALALSFQKEGYPDENALDFDRSVMNWEDEENYHTTEDALFRLFSTLPDTDPNAPFIFGTLSNTWEACRTRHYKTCGREDKMQHGGWACVETYGDIYGDQVLLTGAYAEFDFDYLITDDDTLTVGERDFLLGSLEAGLQEFLSHRTQDQLSNEETMESSLKEEMGGLLAKLDGKITWSGNNRLTYRWFAPYELEAASYHQETESPVLPSDGKFREYYDTVLEKLHFDTCQDMSVADFDRLVNAAFSDGGDGRGGFAYAWEYVITSLSPDDPNYFFLQDTVNAALDEYRARAQTVYTGAQADPSHRGFLLVEKKEDVFGDSLTVGQLSADYTLNYRILNADLLTVQERDRFLAEINNGAQRILQAALEEGTVETDDVKNALEAAAKEAGNEYIKLTGCEINYYEPYLYQD